MTEEPVELLRKLEEHRFGETVTACRVDSTEEGYDFFEDVTGHVQIDPALWTDRFQGYVSTNGATASVRTSMTELELELGNLQLSLSTL